MSSLSNIREVTSDYNVVLTDELLYVVTSGADITITLPTQPITQGVQFTIFRPSNSTGFQVIIDGNGADINDLPQIILAANDNVTLTSYNGLWLIPGTNIYNDGTTGPPGPTGPTGPTGPSGSGVGGRIYSSRGVGNFTGSDISIIPNDYYGSTAISGSMVQPGTQIQIILRGTFSGFSGSTIEFQIRVGEVIIHIASQTLTVTTGTCPFYFDGLTSVIAVSGTTATFRASFLATIGKGLSATLPGDNSIGPIGFSNIPVTIAPSLPINVIYKHSNPSDTLIIYNATIVVF